MLASSQLVGGFNTFEIYYIVKMGIFPKFRGNICREHVVQLHVVAVEYLPSGSDIVLDDPMYHIYCSSWNMDSRVAHVFLTNKIQHLQSITLD